MKTLPSLQRDVVNTWVMLMCVSVHCPASFHQRKTLKARALLKPSFSEGSTMIVFFTHCNNVPVMGQNTTQVKGGGPSACLIP